MGESGPDGLVALLLVAVLIAINGLAVFNEFALVAIPPTRVSALKEGSRLERMVAHSVEHLDDYIAADQLAITITSIAVGWFGQPAITRMLTPLFEAIGLPPEAAAPLVAGIIAFSLITGTQMVLGELVPKSVALRFPERVALAIVLPIEVMATVLRPVTLLMNGAGRLILRPFGIRAGMASHHASSDVAELVESIQGSAEAGHLLRPGTVRNAIVFGELRARDVMLPRGEVASLSADWSVAEMLAAARARPYVRYPVHRGDLDSTFGFLNITELAVRPLPPDGGPEAWTHAVRPIAEIHEAASLEDVLATFRVRRQQLCLVVDGSGGVEGIVSLTDVMAGMVGTAADQAATTDLLLLVQGSDTVAEVEARTGLRIGEGVGAATLSGLLTERLERFPEVGDRLHIGGAVLTVRSVDGTLAGEVAVERIAPPSS